MAGNLTLTAVFEEVENGWVQARIAELPGVITAAPTRAQAQELIIDALTEYLRSLTETENSELRIAGDRTDLELVIAVA